ncbi:hypothetical protein GC169_11580 [bacterium]|nr:hypothetical protein [bacterium]
MDDHPSGKDAKLGMAGSFAPAPVFNVEDYREDIAELGIPDEQAAEFLRTLWDIMRAFVELGWGVDSIHFALPELRDEDLHRAQNDGEMEHSNNDLHADKSAGKEGAS